jgi:hypothetical protein
MREVILERAVFFLLDVDPQANLVKFGIWKVRQTINANLHNYNLSSSAIIEKFRRGGKRTVGAAYPT